MKNTDHRTKQGVRDLDRLFPKPKKHRKVYYAPPETDEDDVVFDSEQLD